MPANPSSLAERTGDTAWRGVNLRLDPANLPPGFYSEGINVRCRDGVVETRRGSLMIPWLNRITAADTDISGTAYSQSGISYFTTLSGPHNRLTGDTVTLSGFDNSALNGTFVITVLSPTRFSYASGVATGISTANLIAHWRLEENGAAARVDAHTNGLNLAPFSTIGTVAAAAGKLGNAAHFVKASSQFLRGSGSAIMSPGNSSFTICGWIKPSSGALDDAIPWGKWGYSAINSAYKLEYTAYFVLGKLRFYVSIDGAAVTTVETAGTLSAAWHFVVCWRDVVAGTVNIQVDDGAVVSTASLLMTANTLTPFQIGASYGRNSPSVLNDGVSFMGGDIDSVSFFKRTLTAAERTILYNAGAGLDYPFGVRVDDPNVGTLDGGAADASVQSWGTVYGQGVFRDPTTFREYVLIAADGNVYACLANNPARVLPLPAGQMVLERCTFVQCFNAVVLLRGFNEDPLVMTDIQVGFTAITMSLTGTGTLPIPRALRGVFAANRLFVARQDDSMVASDIQDYTHFTEFDDFRVNQGDDDKIVAIVTFGTSTLVVLKQKSVYRIDQVFGDLTDASFSEVTHRYGCVAADTVVDCGSDLLWLSQEGVASLLLTIQNEIQAAQGALAGKYRMFSDDIGPLVDRVHGIYAANAFAVLWQDRYYIALPIDQAELLGDELAPQGWSPVSSNVRIPTTIGATYRWQPDTESSLIDAATGTFLGPAEFVAGSSYVTIHLVGTVVQGSLREMRQGVNTVLAVYDFQPAAWAGYDEAAGVAFKFLFTATYLGRQRLFSVTEEGWIRLWEEGTADRLTNPYAEVSAVAANPVGVLTTLQVNGGDLLVANAFDFNLAGLLWGVTGLGMNTPVANLFGDGAIGFYGGNTSQVWSAPNVRTQFAAAAVRFYGTNGVQPEVVVDYSNAEAQDTLQVAGVATQPVAFTFVSRGYVSQSLSRARPQWLDLQLETWSPSFSVSLLGDGVNEERVLCTDRTKSRTQYYRPFNARPWLSTNVNDDHGTELRRDYSILQSGSAWTFDLGSGTRTDLHQAKRETFRMRARPEDSIRVKVTNTNGRVRLLQARLRTKRVADRISEG